MNLEETRTYAIDKHKEQKYNDKPYSYHLDQVYDLVCEANLTDNFKFAAYLHDVLEDTTTTRVELAKKFNEEICLLVYCVTGEGSNRKEKTKSILNKLKQYPQSIDLKLADRIVNMRNSKDNAKLYAMYMKELPLYEDLFQQANPYLYSLLSEFTSKNRLNFR